jgi:diketogulonate reductase-like aldo/keto reductase
MKTVELPSGEVVPALGQGTWHMGDNPKLRGEEIATLRLGLELGLRLIDTAEM